MGAGASITSANAGSLTDTGWGWWFFNAAAAATYTYNWTLSADAVTVTGPLPAATKFAPGPPPAGIVWPVNAPTHTGGLGSIANATQSGTSTVNPTGWYTYTASTSVNANAVAVPNGRASATSTILDPWQVPVRHIAGRPSLLAVNATLDVLLSPTPRGSSAFALFGSFGEIRLDLDGASNAPACQVRLEPGWTTYLDLAFPSVGRRMPAPANPLSADDLKQLLLDQHDPAVPLWHWQRAAPAFTFVKEVASGVSLETVEISLSAEDAETGEDQRRQGHPKA